MAKRKKVLNHAEYNKIKSMKGHVRQSVKLAAINAQSHIYNDRKKDVKSGKIKHKGRVFDSAFQSTQFSA